MPIYEYQCRQCGHEDSDLDSINAPRLKKCPHCGKRAFERLISAAAFHLKGGGWYETDFKNKPASKSAEKDEAAKKSDDKTESGDKSDAKAEKSGADKAADSTDKKGGDKDDKQSGDKSSSKSDSKEKSGGGSSAKSAKGAKS